MKLPEKFTETFIKLLGEEEFSKFAEALNAKRTWGLRANTLKLTIGDLVSRNNFNLKRIPWSRDGFSHDGSSAPGKHPDYHAGLYYIQEPSAMLPAEILNPKAGECVLDLCAAPGGKTVQLAAMMENTGFLLANDISPKRVKPLRRNLEGLGVACAAVSNEEPGRILTNFKNFFDAILLDVPCSGEGMFRKDETAVRSWKRHDRAALIKMQREILLTSWAMLKPGGRMVYSTCTFNPDENERNIEWALSRLEDMKVIELDLPEGGLQNGRSDWAEACPAVAKAIRVWPHHANGEGQFAVLLQKGESKNEFVPDTGSDLEATSVSGTAFNYAPNDACEALCRFMEEEIAADAKIIGTKRLLKDSISSQANILAKGTSLFLCDFGKACEPHRLFTLRLEMPGLYLGEWSYNRFEPSSALLHAISPDSAKRRWNLEPDSKEAKKYLHGETLLKDGELGWTAILSNGHPLGWAKQEDGRIKNMYPKGWRML